MSVIGGWMVAFFARSLFAQILAGVIVAMVVWKTHGAAREWMGWNKGFKEAARQVTEQTKEKVSEAENAIRGADVGDPCDWLRDRKNNSCRDCGRLPKGAGANLRVQRGCVDNRDRAPDPGGQRRPTNSVQNQKGV